MGPDPTGHSLEASGLICSGLVLPQQLGLACSYIFTLQPPQKNLQNLQNHTSNIFKQQILHIGVQVPPSPPSPPLPIPPFAPVTDTPCVAPRRAPTAPAPPSAAPRAATDAPRGGGSGAAAAPRRPADAGNAAGLGPGAASKTLPGCRAGLDPQNHEAKTHQVWGCLDFVNKIRNVEASSRRLSMSSMIHVAACHGKSPGSINELNGSRWPCSLTTC